MNKLFKIAYIAFIALVCVVGVLLVATLIPIPGNAEVKIVQSGSMEPAIKVGSVVVVKPANSYRVGDIVTFGEDTREQVPTTHRIISERVSEGVVLYTTQGDANDDPDPQEITESDIIGKVLLDVPFLGFILDFARQPIGFILLIGIPAAIVVIDEVAKIWNEVRELRSKKKTGTGRGKKQEDSDLHNKHEHEEERSANTKAE